MNIYLDIDGVILDKQGNQAPHVFEFLEALLAHHTVFWLSTHCKGDTEHLIPFLERRVSPRIMPLVKQIQPTNWQTLKTEAIDFDQDFRWFDDAPLEVEKQVLKQHGCLEKLVVVDLRGRMGLKFDRVF